MTDLTKPVQTRDGRPVEIISTKGREPYPVVGYVGDIPYINSWMRDGRFYISDVSARDLVNFPEERSEFAAVRINDAGFIHNIAYIKLTTSGGKLTGCEIVRGDSK